MWVFAILYCAPWILLTKTEPVYYKGRTGIETCTFKISRQSYFGYFFADLLLFYVLPLVLSCVLYGLIARILFSDTISKSMSKSSKSSKSKGKSTASKNGEPRTPSTKEEKSTFSAETKKSSSQSGDAAKVQVRAFMLYL